MVQKCVEQLGCLQVAVNIEACTHTRKLRQQSIQHVHIYTVHLCACAYMCICTYMYIYTLKYCTFTLLFTVQSAMSFRIAGRIFEKLRLTNTRQPSLGRSNAAKQHMYANQVSSVHMQIFSMQDGQWNT